MRSRLSRAARAALTGSLCGAATFIPLSPAEPHSPSQRYAETTASGAASGDHVARPDTAPDVLRAELTLGEPGTRIPSSFSGLSLEPNELPAFERRGLLFDRAISLIRAAHAPVLLRIGGKSADYAYWRRAPASAAKSGVFMLDDKWLVNLARLAQRDHLRVMLTVNLAIHSPAMAAAFAGAAARALPAPRLAALAIGNEPDLYHRQPALEREGPRDLRPGIRRHWTRGYGPADYRRDYAAYAAALNEAVPAIPLAAPEVASSNPNWLRVTAGLAGLEPSTLAVHLYATTTCGTKNSPYYPTVAMLLSDDKSRGLAQRLRRRVSIARASGTSVRVSEFNAVSCGGGRGVADSFATALWAPDALFEMIAARASGVNWHVRPRMANAPFLITSRGFVARPELYGLALFAQIARPGARLVTGNLSQARGVHIKAWAVASRSRLSVLLINKGGRGALVRVQAGARTGAAQLERLRAPLSRSRTGVTLAGRWIGADARWHGRRRTTPLRSTNGGYDVFVPAYSAALIDASRAA
jgi:hypothetical protein